jgi:hypothetical protein
MGVQGHKNSLTSLLMTQKAELASTASGNWEMYWEPVDIHSMFLWESKLRTGMGRFRQINMQHMRFMTHPFDALS